jgi:hypothetical protein
MTAVPRVAATVLLLAAWLVWPKLAPPVPEPEPVRREPEPPPFETPFRNTRTG